jgi:transcription antitermination factor NusG
MERNIYEWYVVYTRQGMEMKVVKELTKKSIECYCPANKTSGKWWILSKKNQQPLFTSYVFAKVSEKEVPSLKKINGVVNILYWLGRPAVVKEDEIHMIKEFLCNHADVSVEKTMVKTMNYVYGNSTAAYGYGTQQSAEGYKLELPTIGYRVVAARTADVRVVSMPKQVEAPLLQPQYSHAG